MPQITPLSLSPSIVLLSVCIPQISGSAAFRQLISSTRCAGGRVGTPLDPNPEPRKQHWATIPQISPFSLPIHCPFECVPSDQRLNISDMIVVNLLFAVGRLRRILGNI